MKRYKLLGSTAQMGIRVETIEDKDGEWVRYVDIKDALNASEACGAAKACIVIAQDNMKLCVPRVSRGRGIKSPEN